MRHRWRSERNVGTYLGPTNCRDAFEVNHRATVTHQSKAGNPVLAVPADANRVAAIPKYPRCGEKVIRVSVIRRQVSRPPRVSRALHSEP